MTSFLAIETSTATARVAVLGEDARTQAVAEAVSDRRSSVLLRLCDEALRAAGLDVARLGGIACGAGPGSFTGLRVGLAVAKGLCAAADLPLVLVSSLSALARDLAAVARPGAILVPCLDAGKGQVYAARVEPGREDPGSPWILTPEALAEQVRAAPAETLAVGGPGVERHAALFGARLDSSVLHRVRGPTAEAVGRLALPRLLRREGDSLDAAIPSYGRPADITRPRAGGG